MTRRAIIIELKQWAEARLTNKDAIVNTLPAERVSRQNTHLTGLSHAALLEDFSETVHAECLPPPLRLLAQLC